MEIENELAKVLEPGETLLWSAQPDPWHYARPTFVIYIAAVPWTVFSFFWLNAVSGGFQLPKKVAYPFSQWTPWIAIGTGLFLFLAGLWMLSGPFWIWRKSKRVIYAVTTQRAILLDTRAAGKAEILPLQGTVNFRIAAPKENISDLEIVCGTARGLVLRAVKQPAQAIAEISTRRTDAS